MKKRFSWAGRGDEGFDKGGESGNPEGMDALLNLAKKPSSSFLKAALVNEASSSSTALSPPGLNGPTAEQQLKFMQLSAKKSTSVVPSEVLKVVSKTRLVENTN